MNIGWVSPEGTNDWRTVSTVGTSIVIRVPLFREWVNRGDKIFWYGLKENGHRLEGVEHKSIIPDYEMKRLVRDYLNEAKKAYEDLPKKEKKSITSKSKWQTERAIKGMLKTLVDIEPAPIDVLFMEYMDNGMHQIVFFSVILLWYAQNTDVPIYVRDTENKFRYVSEYKILHDEARDNTYSHRLGRYVPEDLLSILRGRIRMVYAFDASEWDDGTEGFYRLPPIFFPMVYDPSRELVIPKRKEMKTPVVYIGNDNNRRPMFTRWYGSLRHEAQIYGNWIRRAGDFVDGFQQNPNVNFNEPIKQDVMLERLRRAYSTVFVTKEIYAKCGQVTTRSVEVSLAGTIAVVPTSLPKWETWALSDFVVNSPDGMNNVIEDIMSMSSKQYRDAIMAQRQIVSEHYHTDVVMEMLEEEFRNDIESSTGRDSKKFAGAKRTRLRRKHGVVRLVRQ